MAIEKKRVRFRRGPYSQFDPDKMLPDEIWVVTSGDPNTIDGRAVYVCVTAGVVKLLTTHEDLEKQIEDVTSDIVSELTEDVGGAVASANSAAEHANTAAEKAQGQAQSAEEAANLANNTAEDLISRRDSGEFTGPQGPEGPQGPKGDSGVMAPASGMFSLYLDSETGNLYAEYPDGSSPPQFEYDPETGNLYFVTDEGGD